MTTMVLATYGRTAWHRTAEFVYNHVACPPMVLWLGEAVGVSSDVIKTAASAALAAGPTQMAQAAAIRRLIPWSMIKQMPRDHKRRCPFLGEGRTESGHRVFG